MNRQLCSGFVITVLSVLLCVTASIVQADDDDAATRAQLIETINNQISAIAQQVGKSSSDSSSDSIQAAIQQTDSLRENIENLDKVKGDDDKANAIVDHYKDYIETFVDSAKALAKLKDAQAQQNQKTLWKRCAELDEQIHQLVKQYVDPKDPAGLDKVPNAADDAQNQIHNDLSAQLEQADDIAHAHDDARNFSVSDGAWSDVSSGMRDATDSIWENYDAQLKDTREKCANIDKGKDNPLIVEAMATLQSADATSKQMTQALSDIRNKFDQLKSKFNDVSSKVDNYLERTKKLRAMDKDDLNALIDQICRLDFKDRDDDEASALAKTISDKMIAQVQGEYDSVLHDGEQLESDVESVMGDLKALREQTKDALTSDKVKDDKQSLLSEETDWVGKSDDLFSKLMVDKNTLANIKDGSLKGANNPRVRGAMEYGKDRHRYNQQICAEKELTLSSGRPDCVTFQKPTCIVWEFKPSSYSEDDAKSQATKYLEDVQNMFKNDPRAIENCQKDSDGLPIFEARGVTYPACSSSKF